MQLGLFWYLLIMLVEALVLWWRWEKCLLLLVWRSPSLWRVSSTSGFALDRRWLIGMVERLRLILIFPLIFHGLVRLIRGIPRLSMHLCVIS
jgi:hypothetical protein